MDSIRPALARSVLSCPALLPSPPVRERSRVCPYRLPLSGPVLSLAPRRACGCSAESTTVTEITGSSAQMTRVPTYARESGVYFSLGLTNYSAARSDGWNVES